MTELSTGTSQDWLVRNWKKRLGFGLAVLALGFYIGDDIRDGGTKLFLQRLFDSLDDGAIYSVVAMALVLIFKATTLINFAQGELAMFGTFVAYVGAVSLRLENVRVGPVPLGLVFSIVVAMAISAGVGAGIERVLIRPFDPSDHLPVVLITFGLFLILNSSAAFIWNTNARSFPGLFPDRNESGAENYLEIAGARLFYDVIGTSVVVAVMGLALYFILARTKIGLAFRAVSSNTESARLVGVRVGRVLGFGWALASAFGTLGGALVAPKLNLKPDMMALLLIFSFAAATVGGLDSLIGAVVGGMIIGLVKSFLVPYLGDNNSAFSALSLAVAFVVILSVLWAKPSGLFGTSAVKRV